MQAIRSPGRLALVDELGTLSFARLNARTNALARGLHAEGVREGESVAVLCRNHRGFVEAAVAASKLGANAVCMNTGFAGPQIAEVCGREGVSTLIYDEEFSDAVEQAAASARCFTAWSEAGGQHEHPTLEQGASGRPDGNLAPPTEGACRDPDLGHDRAAEGSQA